MNWVPQSERLAASQTVSCQCLAKTDALALQLRCRFAAELVGCAVKMRHMHQPEPGDTGARQEQPACMRASLLLARDLSPQWSAVCVSKAYSFQLQ